MSCAYLRGRSSSAHRTPGGHAKAFSLGHRRRALHSQCNSGVSRQETPQSLWWHCMPQTHLQNAAHGTAAHVTAHLWRAGVRCKHDSAALITCCLVNDVNNVIRPTPHNVAWLCLAPAQEHASERNRTEHRVHELASAQRLLVRWNNQPSASRRARTCCVCDGTWSDGISVGLRMSTLRELARNRALLRNDTTPTQIPCEALRTTRAGDRLLQQLSRHRNESCPLVQSRYNCKAYACRGRCEVRRRASAGCAM